MDSTQVWVMIGVFGSIVPAIYFIMRDLLRDSVGGLEARMDARFTGLEARMDERFGAVDARFGAVDARFGTVDARFTGLETRMNERFDREREYNGLRFSALEQRLDGVESDLTIIKAHLISEVQPLRLTVLAEAKHD